MDGVARALPALLRAQKLIRRAARKGFEWPAPEAALAKCREELDEVRDAAASESGHRRLEEELGDLLFACVAAAGQYRVDAEEALRRANAKFEERFGRVEAALREDGREMTDASLEDLDRLWNRAKMEVH